MHNNEVDQKTWRELIQIADWDTKADDYVLRKLDRDVTPDHIFKTDKFHTYRLIKRPTETEKDTQIFNVDTIFLESSLTNKSWSEVRALISVTLGRVNIDIAVDESSQQLSRLNLTNEQIIKSLRIIMTSYTDEGFDESLYHIVMCFASQLSDLSDVAIRFFIFHCFLKQKYSITLPESFANNLSTSLEYDIYQGISNEYLSKHFIVSDNKLSIQDVPSQKYIYECLHGHVITTAQIIDFHLSCNRIYDAVMALQKGVSAGIAKCDQDHLNIRQEDPRFKNQLKSLEAESYLVSNLIAKSISLTSISELIKAPNLDGLTRIIQYSDDHMNDDKLGMEVRKTLLLALMSCYSKYVVSNQDFDACRNVIVQKFPHVNIAEHHWYDRTDQSFKSHLILSNNIPLLKSLLGEEGSILYQANPVEIDALWSVAEYMKETDYDLFDHFPMEQRESLDLHNKKYQLKSSRAAFFQHICKKIQPQKVILNDSSMKNLPDLITGFNAILPIINFKNWVDRCEISQFVTLYKKFKSHERLLYWLTEAVSVMNKERRYNFFELSVSELEKHSAIDYDMKIQFAINARLTSEKINQMLVKDNKTSVDFVLTGELSKDDLDYRMLLLDSYMKLGDLDITICWDIEHIPADIQDKVNKLKIKTRCREYDSRQPKYIKEFEQCEDKASMTMDHLLNVLIISDQYYKEVSDIIINKIRKPVANQDAEHVEDSIGDWRYLLTFMANQDYQKHHDFVMKVFCQFKIFFDSEFTDVHISTLLNDEMQMEFLYKVYQNVDEIGKNDLLRFICKRAYQLNDFDKLAKCIWNNPSILDDDNSELARNTKFINGLFTEYSMCAEVTAHQNKLINRVLQNNASLRCINSTGSDDIVAAIVLKKKYEVLKQLLSKEVKLSNLALEHLLLNRDFKIIEQNNIKLPLHYSIRLLFTHPDLSYYVLKHNLSQLVLLIHNVFNRIKKVFSLDTPSSCTSTKSAAFESRDNLTHIIPPKPSDNKGPVWRSR